MRRAKQLALAVTSALFTAVGLAMVFADPEERLTGIIIALFFGSCLLVFLAQLFERGERKPRRTVVAHRGARSEALVFPLAAGKMRIFAVAGAAWAVAGGLFLVYPGSIADPGESTVFVRLLGAALVFMFGGLAIITLTHELRGGGFVGLLPEGVLARAGFGRSFVPWDAIESVGVVTMYDTPMVAVSTSDPAAVETSNWARIVSRANRALMGADLFYSNLTVPEEELAAAIAERLEHPEKRERPGEA